MIVLTVLALAAAAFTTLAARTVLRFRQPAPPVSVEPPPVDTPRPPSLRADALRRLDPLLILRHAVDAHRVQARGAGVTLFAPPPSGGFALKTRAGPLAEILDILLANAVRWNRPGGAVLAELRRTQDGLAVMIHDTGPGLDRDTLQRLFHPAGGERGLPRAWRLARALGGRLSAASTPGQGSTFTLHLPGGRAAEDRASALPAPNALLSAAVLLLIDPDPVRAALIRRLTTALGASLLVSPNAEEGLTLARDLRPDLILIEPFLPGLDGFALKTALDADPLTRGLPVVALSADPDPALARRGRLAGFHGWLTRPLEIPLFVLTLTRALSDRAPPRASDAA